MNHKLCFGVGILTVCCSAVLSRCRGSATLKSFIIDTFDLRLGGYSVMAALILNVTVDEVTAVDDRVKQMHLMSMR